MKMLPLLFLVSSTLALVPQTSVHTTRKPLVHHSTRASEDSQIAAPRVAMDRRSCLSVASALFLAGSSFVAPSSAAKLSNEAEDKLAAILAKKVKDREEQLGFTLDADDIRDLENVLRNKYCGPAGAFSGEPGGTCAESPKAEATCFKATGFAQSCTKSYDK